MDKAEAEAKSNTDMASAEVDHYRTCLADAEDKCEQLQATLDEERAARSTASATEKAALEAEVTRLQGVEAEKQQLQAELASLRQQLKVRDKTDQELQAEREALLQRAEEGDEQLVTVSTEVAKLQARCTEAEAAVRTIQKELREQQVARQQAKADAANAMQAKQAAERKLGDMVRKLSEVRFVLKLLLAYLVTWLSCTGTVHAPDDATRACPAASAA